MEVINIENWSRAEHFKFFRNMDFPQYNICMNIDITNFLSKVKEKKLPFYYAMIYATMSAANATEEFRYRFRSGDVILHDKIHPSFTEMTAGSELFKLVTLDLRDSMEEFVEAAKRKADSQTAHFPLDEMNREDLVYITCIPWISFTHLSHTFSLKKDDAVPRLSWGKYYKDGDKVHLPYSVQVHHAFADGIHVGKFVERLQEYLNSYQ